MPKDLRKRTSGRSGFLVEDHFGSGRPGRCNEWRDNFITQRVAAAKWKENFRMNRETFLKLCDDRRLTLEGQATRRRMPLSVERQVFVTLYYLEDEGRLRNVANAFGIETAEPTENTPQVALNLQGSLVSKVGEVAYGRDSNSNSSSDNSSSSRSDGLSSSISDRDSVSFSNSDSLSLGNSETETDSGSDGGGRSNGGEELNRDDQNSRGCAASPCGKGTCQDVNGGYSCVCPLEWQGSNCKDFVDNCFSNSVGVANPDIISDQQMTASSQREVSFQASHGRLNGQGWCARNGTSRGEWLRVDFNRTVDLCAVSTQGIERSWVTEFKLSYITTKGNWISYKGADGKVVVSWKVIK
ncbi:uncharacterized protein LOC111342145 [Stylophora pistillata]|uniref:uncharacterized protein LOC111342145 n=1 Tax=Stylophora pistillata TaxID=50429 RepID=UPI000C0438C1|nr:uncharacterized protein LOC111342145 [Stylophora pistillata]